MNGARWARVKALFNAALEIEPKQRAAWIARSCGDDLALLDEVQAMLAAHETGSGFELDRRVAGQPIRSTLGEFEVGKPIGVGGMGVVYRARQQSLDRDVALKVLHRDIVGSAARIERFRDEARRVGQLRHPGIVAVHTFGSEKDIWFFAMELVEGHDLQKDLDLLSRERAASKRHHAILPRFGTAEYYRAAARVVTEAAEALRYAHERGIVHRDVKPQNILLTRDGHAKVVDFGIAREAAFGAADPRPLSAGTPHYMSPEQVEATRAVVDHRTDIYSLGVVLYQLLTLRLPFGGKTWLDVLDSIRRFEPPNALRINRGAPRDLVLVCMHAMARSPTGRYASAGEFAADLERFLRGEPVLAPAPSRIERAWNALRRRRRTVLVVTACAVAAPLSLTVFVAWKAYRARDVQSGRDEAEHVRVRLQVSGGAANACSVQIRCIAVTPSLDAVVESDIKVEQQIEGDSIVLCGMPRTDVLIVIDAGAVGRAELRRDFQSSPMSVSERVTLRPDSEALRDMVHVPGGSVQLMFTPRSVDAGFDRTSTCCQVAPFWIDRAPLTNAQFAAFARATGVPLPAHWCGELPEGWSDRPVTLVDASTARACAEWYGKRLPTRAEYEWLMYTLNGSPWPMTTDGRALACATGSFTAPFRPTYAASKEEGWYALHDWYFAFIPSISQLPAGPLGVLSPFGIVREWVDDAPLEREHGVLKREESWRYRVGWSCEKEPLQADVQVYLERRQMAAPALDPDIVTSFRCVRSAHR